MPSGASSKLPWMRLAARNPTDYEPIEMPANSPTGIVCAFFTTMLGFALVWHIWWLAGFGLIGAYVTFAVFAWRDRTERVIPAEEVARIDRLHAPKGQSS